MRALLRDCTSRGRIVPHGRGAQMQQGRTGGSMGAPRLTPPDDIADEVFDQFPYGIVVVAGDRRVIAANEAARALLGDAKLGRAEQICCDVLGCHSDPIADACMTELAVASDEPLPELRVDRDESPYG